MSNISPKSLILLQMTYFTMLHLFNFGKIPQSLNFEGIRGIKINIIRFLSEWHQEKRADIALFKPVINWVQIL